MYEHEPDMLDEKDSNESARQPPAITDNEEPGAEKKQPPAAMPKPVFMRLLMLFGGSGGCLLAGIVMAVVTGDMVLLAMSVLLCASFAVKGIMLRKKIISGHIYSVSGVCVSITPKMWGRYRRMELLNTDTGDDAVIVLPKKTIFKVGHVYTCYFDSQINSRADDVSGGSFFGADMELPTNGFLGFENFGVYQEKPAVAKDTPTSAETGDTPKENGA